MRYKQGGKNQCFLSNQLVNTAVTRSLGTLVVMSKNHWQNQMLPLAKLGVFIFCSIYLFMPHMFSHHILLCHNMSSPPIVVPYHNHSFLGGYHSIFCLIFDYLLHATVSLICYARSCWHSNLLLCHNKCCCASYYVAQQILLCQLVC